MDSLSTRITQLRHAVRANRAHIDLPLASSAVYSTNSLTSSKQTRFTALLQLLQREGYIAS